MYWANICLFDPDMLVFVDESGFVSSHNTLICISQKFISPVLIKKWSSPAKKIPLKIKFIFFENIVD